MLEILAAKQRQKCSVENNVGARLSQTRRGGPATHTAGKRGLDQNLSQTRSGSTYYYVADGLGSIRNLIDSNETAQNTYDYYAFGKELGSWTENVTNRYTYTAREWDVESGMYYFRARSYNALTGRFLARDTWFGLLNRGYIYVRNRPTIFIDPLGLYEEEFEGDWTQAEKNAVHASFARVRGLCVVLHKEIDALLQERITSCCDWGPLVDNLKILRSILNRIMEGIDSTTHNLEIYI